MRRASAVVTLVMIVLALALPAFGSVEHCPDGGTKTEGEFNSLVLDAGTVFCVKASNEASGVLVADGEQALIDYVTWLNNGGKTPNVSHYVIYEQTTTTTGQTTTTVEDTTTTTVEATTTTVPQETTTTVIEESTTTSVVESTTTLAPTTTAPAVTTTPPVVELEELPFTGVSSAHLAAIASGLSVLGLVILAMTRDK